MYFCMVDLLFPQHCATLLKSHLTGLISSFTDLHVLSESMIILAFFQVCFLISVWNWRFWRSSTLCCCLFSKAGKLLLWSCRPLIPISSLIHLCCCKYFTKKGCTSAYLFNSVTVLFQSFIWKFITILSPYTVYCCQSSWEWRKSLWFECWAKKNIQLTQWGEHCFYHSLM